jgi:hypothetical protein
MAPRPVLQNEKRAKASFRFPDQRAQLFGTTLVRA